MLKYFHSCSIKSCFEKLCKINKKSMCCKITLFLQNTSGRLLLAVLKQLFLQFFITIWYEFSISKKTNIHQTLKFLILQYFCTSYKYNWSTRNSHRRCSIKKVFLEISQNSQENTCARVSFLIKLQTWSLQLY